MKINHSTSSPRSIFTVIALCCGLSACGSDDPAPADTPVVNSAPVVSSTAVVQANEGVEYSYSITASDADGDSLTMQATTLPAWLSLNSTTGVLSGTPATADVGSHAVVISVSDGSDTTTQSFTIVVAAVVVANTPPTITSTAVVSGQVGSAYTYTLVGADADGDTLALSSVVLPTWASFDTSSGVLSGTPDASGSYSVELLVSDGTDSVSQTFSIVVSEAPSGAVALVVFENEALAQWAAWDCCGGSTASIETDDVDHDQVTKFTIVGDTVVGFTARAADGAVGGAPFDASAFEADGTLVFDLKMIKAPDAGTVDWFLKVESNGAASFVQLNLASSQESHNTPQLNTWQTYTFNLSALKAGGLDLSQIDLFMIFPAWGSGNGAEFYVDNLQIREDGAMEQVPPVVNTQMNIDFEVGGAGNAGYSWAVFENEDNPALEIVANPATDGINTSSTVAKFTARQAGNPWAGTETKSGPTFTLDASNKIVRIMVYKTVISDVGIKFAVGPAAQPELKVANTKVNEWEELTFDFSSYIGLAETINIDTVIVFPDFDLAGRSSDTINYFDNISFSDN